mmetsp:Transcript_11464/g.35034  ORF Transcript_11464/g.35034 Transcript_11464/m.35034 type:complete len:190 (-) Transcript_11464:1658-2227(-)
MAFAVVHCSCGTGSRSDSAKCRIFSAAAAATLAVASVFSTPALAVGVQNGRLAECKANQNCVSTSSVKNPSKFGAPWTYLPQTNYAQSAWNSLIATVASQPESEIIDLDRSYLHAVFKGFPTGQDDVEFLLNEEKGIVSYRSCSREVIYIYPFQQPMGDFGTNRKRLESIRQQLGWEILNGGYQEASKK